MAGMSRVNSSDYLFYVIYYSNLYFWHDIIFQEQEITECNILL